MYTAWQVILSYMNENNANREEEDPLQICDLLEWLLKDRKKEQTQTPRPCISSISRNTVSET